MAKAGNEKREAKAWLEDVVEEEGRYGAARVLGVNYRTLARGLAAGELTGRLRDAVEEAMAREAAGDGGNPSPASPAAPSDDRNGQATRETEEDGDADDGAIPSSASGTQVAAEEPASGVEGEAVSATPVTEGEAYIAKLIAEQAQYELPEEDEAWAGDWWWQWKWIDQILPKDLATEKASPKEAERMGVEVAETVARWRAARDLWRPLRERKENAGEVTKELWRLELEADEVAAELRMRELEVQLIEEMRVTLPPSRWPWNGGMLLDQVIWRDKTIVRLRRELPEAEWARDKGRRRQARRKRWRRRWSRLKARVFRGGRSEGA